MNDIRITGSGDAPGLNEQIQDALSRSGLTVAEFCDRLEIQRQYWYQIRKGERPLPLSTLRKIEEVLETDFGVEL